MVKLFTKKKFDMCEGTKGLEREVCELKKFRRQYQSVMNELKRRLEKRGD